MSGTICHLPMTCHFCSGGIRVFLLQPHSWMTYTCLQGIMQQCRNCSPSQRRNFGPEDSASHLPNPSSWPTRASRAPVHTTQGPIHPAPLDEPQRVLGVWCGAQEGSDAHVDVAISKSWAAFMSLKHVLVCKRSALKKESARSQQQSLFNCAVECWCLETQQKGD